MKKKTYDLEKNCYYCEKATPLLTEDQVLCSKKGVVSSAYCCRAFHYDPLKRAPKRPVLSGIDDNSVEELP